MPHVYGSSTFKNGLATITLRQVLGKGNPDVTEFVKTKVVPDAKDRLCMVWQSSKLKESAAFLKYFNPQAREDFNADGAA